MGRPGQPSLHANSRGSLLSRLQAVLGSYLLDLWAPSESTVGTSISGATTLVRGIALTSPVAFPVISSASFGGRAVWKFDQADSARLVSATLATLVPAGSVPYCVSYHRHTTLVGGYNLALSCGTTGTPAEGWALGGYAGSTSVFSAGDYIGGPTPVLNVARLVEGGMHSATHKRSVVDGAVNTAAGTATGDLVILGTRTSGHKFYGEVALQMLLTSTPPDGTLASMRTVITSYFA